MIGLTEEESDVKQFYGEELRNLQACCLTNFFFRDEVKGCDVNWSRRRGM
jgi:hypothetical protein